MMKSIWESQQRLKWVYVLFFARRNKLVSRHILFKLIQVEYASFHFRITRRYPLILFFNFLIILVIKNFKLFKFIQEGSFYSLYVLIVCADQFNLTLRHLFIKYRIIVTLKLAAQLPLFLVRFQCVGFNLIDLGKVVNASFTLYELNHDVGKRANLERANELTRKQSYHFLDRIKRGTECRWTAIKNPRGCPFFCILHNSPLKF